MKMENRTGSMIKAVMFDNVKELVDGRMKEYCEHKEVWINWSHAHLHQTESLNDLSVWP